MLRATGAIKSRKITQARFTCLCLNFALCCSLKIRKVEYKDPAEEEWEIFQKVMQVETQVTTSGTISREK